MPSSTSQVITYMPNFVKIGQLFQTLEWRGNDTHIKKIVISETPNAPF